MPPSPKAKKASKKPPSRARKATTKVTAEDIPVTKKKSTKTLPKSKAARKKKEVESDSDEGQPGQAREENNDDDVGDDTDDKVDWKDTDLNWSLITILEEDQAIRQGLFPVPGANISVSLGGSKPKTDYQWMLAQRLFENHDKYKDVFASVQTPAEKANWQRKIKNRLKRMTQDVRKYRDMMGETGAGIIHEEDITMERNNSLTQSWAAIKEKCPWFFKLKAIIDERPSAVPVGVGNNSSGYDVSILATSTNTSDFDGSDPGLGLEPLDTTDGGGKGECDGEGISDGPDGDGDGDGDGSDDEGGNQNLVNESLTVEKQVPTIMLKIPTMMKRTAAGVDTPEIKTPQTPACAGKSTPAATTVSHRASKKPKTGIEKINAIAAKEEETSQKALEVRKLKVKGENDKDLARIKAKAEVKLQRMRYRAELAQKKMDNEFRLQMAQMGHPHSPHTYATAGSSGTGAPAAIGSTTFSDVGSVTPSPYSGNSNERLQLDPSLEFYGPNSGYGVNQHFIG